MANSVIQAYKNKPQRKQIQILGGFFLVLVILIVLLVSYLLISSQVVEIGKDLQKAVNTIDQLEYENALMREKIAIKTTNDRLELRAVELGFRPPNTTEVVYMVIPGYQESRTYSEALPQKILYPDVNVNHYEYQITLLGWLRDQLKVFSGYE